MKPLCLSLKMHVTLYTHGSLSLNTHTHTHTHIYIYIYEQTAFFYTFYFFFYFALVGQMGNVTVKSDEYSITFTERNRGVRDGMLYFRDTDKSARLRG